MLVVVKLVCVDNPPLVVDDDDLDDVEVVVREVWDVVVSEDTDWLVVVTD